MGTHAFNWLFPQENATLLKLRYSMLILKLL